ncbi:MAG TPA: SBBP repeat-containing protein, partial [Cryomorphaceae bacterium]|nr:SBBP repeat-containing protein [Cryomorphaceae bacterium]
MKQTSLTALILLFISSLWAGTPSPSADSFVINKGQIRTTAGDINHAVKYLWTSNQGLNVQFKSTGLSFDTYQRCAEDGSVLFHRMDLDFIGANGDVDLLARNRSDQELNVIKGNKQYENIGLYEELIYKNVYKHIDIVAHSGSTHFKYDFILKEGADANDIRMEYKGFDAYQAEAGAITFSLSGKTVTESIPESWLTASGERIQVEYRIVEESENSIVVGFEICDDSHQNETMVIDPEVIPEWSTYHGDSLYDTANAVVTDSLGFIFIAGTTESLEMIASAGSYQNTYAGGESDAYLTRMNQHGLRQWSTYYGGSGTDESIGLCIDNYNRIYLVGQTNSVDSIGTEESQQPANAGLNDGFIAAFNRFGALLWDTYFGGENDDLLCDCFAFNNGRVIALGTTESPQLFLNNGFVTNTAHAGAKDIFLASFDGEGSLSNGNFFGGTGDDEAVAVDINAQGGLFAAANTNTASGLATSDAYSESLQGENDGLIIRMDTLFGVWWSSYFGGAGNDFITDIDVENDSELFYIGGYTDGTIDLVVDTVSAQLEPGGMEDGFVAKLSENAFSEWFTYSGGPENDRIVSIDLDIDTSLYVVGVTASDTNIVFYDEDSVPSQFYGEVDSYLARYDSEGPRVYSKYIGGEGLDRAEGLAVLGRTAYFVVGSTTSEFNMVLTSEDQPTAHQDSYAGGVADAFFA